VELAARNAARPGPRKDWRQVSTDLGLRNRKVQLTAIVAWALMLILLNTMPFFTGGSFKDPVNYCVHAWLVSGWPFALAAWRHRYWSLLVGHLSWATLPILILPNATPWGLVTGMAAGLLAGLAIQAVIQRELRRGGLTPGIRA
jgi:hypothetical protein